MEEGSSEKLKWESWKQGHQVKGSLGGQGARGTQENFRGENLPGGESGSLTKKKKKVQHPNKKQTPQPPFKGNSRRKPTGPQSGRESVTNNTFWWDDRREEGQVRIRGRLTKRFLVRPEEGKGRKWISQNTRTEDIVGWVPIQKQKHDRPNFRL